MGAYAGAPYNPGDFLTSLNATWYKSFFFKGGLSKEFHGVPPFGKGGQGEFWFLEHVS
jgi:hypothetical protein